MKGISDLIDSDMENAPSFMEETSVLSSASDASSVGPSKRSTGQAKKPKKRHRVTMPKPKSRVTKPSEDAPPKKAMKKTTGAKRKALEEQINGTWEDANILESVEKEIEIKPTKKTARSKARKTVEEEVDEDDEVMEIDQTPLAARSHFAHTKKDVPKVTAKNAATVAVRQAKKSAAVPSDLGFNEMGDVSEVVALPPVRATSRVTTESIFRRRAGSASDTERGDPNLRRKLGDVTRKFENIDLKYHNLKEVGINEANANVEKLRKQCEATTQASNELIASLKKELAMQASFATESRRLKKDLQSRESESTELRSKNVELTSSLTAAQNEIKVLQAKLAASRSASVGPENTNSRTPGSALKNPGQMRTVMVGNAEAAQTAQMKEDLYSDLTGLIIRGVKRAEEGNTFDCIQTGRNGTLHFKLFIDLEDAKTTSFEETEFLYTPLLDANRDRDMIELMPEYLAEDITFARQNAAKFYGRVVDTLTKRRSDD